MGRVRVSTYVCLRSATFLELGKESPIVNSMQYTSSHHKARQGNHVEGVNAFKALNYGFIMK